MRLPFVCHLASPSGKSTSRLRGQAASSRRGHVKHRRATTLSPSLCSGAPLARELPPRGSLEGTSHRKLLPPPAAVPLPQGGGFKLVPIEKNKNCLSFPFANFFYLLHRGKWRARLRARRKEFYTLFSPLAKAGLFASAGKRFCLFRREANAEKPDCCKIFQKDIEKNGEMVYDI